jgi:hypothetical protein
VNASPVRSRMCAGLLSADGAFQGSLRLII